MGDIRSIVEREDLGEIFSTVKAELEIAQNEILKDGFIDLFYDTLISRLERETVNQRDGWDRIDIGQNAAQNSRFDRIAAWAVDKKDEGIEVFLLDPYKMDAHVFHVAPGTDKNHIGDIAKFYVKTVNSIGSVNLLYTGASYPAVIDAENKGKSISALATSVFFGAASLVIGYISALRNDIGSIYALGVVNCVAMITTVAGYFAGRYVLGPIVGYLAGELNHKNQLAEQEYIHNNLFPRPIFEPQKRYLSDHFSGNYAVNVAISTSKRSRSLRD
ncbi:MAG: hypothetical protein NDI94_05630 [Candidatus Woesearchaeota archaeon]|nr:hypothetical protein [Candidatus Woesearchaeota archaeon]